MIVKTAVQQQWSISYMGERNFEVLDQAMVDDQQWYTVKCNKEVGNWVRGQPKEQWVNHIDRGWLFYENNFDVHHELYAYLKLSWGE